MELKDWSCLKPLRSYSLKTVRYALVFGKEGSKCLVITRDDLVFGLDVIQPENLYFEKGFPSEISTLSGKGVKGFAYGGNLNASERFFVVAYLNDGRLFHWGSVPCSKTTFVKPTFLHTFKSEVVEIACGFSHCAALCENGQVYTWGCNKKGQLGREEPEEVINGSRKNLKIYQVKGILDGQKVIQISCGAEFTAALIADGRVVCWGCNDERQLGLNDRSPSVAVPTVVMGGSNQVLPNNPLSSVNFPNHYQNSYHVLQSPPSYGPREMCRPSLILQPCMNNQQMFEHSSSSGWIRMEPLVQIESVINVACGRAHVLALTQQSQVMVWGNGRALRFVDQNWPLQTPRFPMDIDLISNTRCLEIGASYLLDFSAILVEYGMNNRRKRIVAIAESSVSDVSDCQSLYEAFRRCTSIMHRPFRPPKNRRSLSDFVENAFYEKDDSDLTIAVNGQRFHVHKIILTLRSEFFRTLLALRTDPHENVLRIENINYQVMEAYLKYLYTDELEADVDLATDLLMMGDGYGDDDFKVICEQILVQKLTIDKVADVYPLTLRHKYLEELKARCIELSVSHPSHLNIIVTSPAFEDWDSKVLHTFLREFAKQNTKLNKLY